MNRNDGKLIIFGQGLKDIKVVSAHIIATAESARLENIGPGMI